MMKIEMVPRLKSGQATIEYLLVIIVIISIAIMFKVINDKYIRPYLNYALGAYIECLLETGQLPYSGSGSSAKSDFNSAASSRKVNISSSGLADEEISCRFDTNKIDIKIAQQEANQAVSAANEAARSQSTSSKSNSPNQVNPSEGSREQSQASNNSGASSNSGSGGNTSSGSRNISSSNGRPAIKKSTAIGTAETGGVATVIEEDGESYQARQKRRRLGGLTEESKVRKVENKGSDQGEKNNKVTTVSTEEGGLASTKRPVNMPPERKTANIDEEDESLGFGQLLKLFLIAAIIIAIIVFVGGQIMNYSNSKEK